MAEGRYEQPSPGDVDTFFEFFWTVRNHYSKKEEQIKCHGMKVL